MSESSTQRDEVEASSGFEEIPEVKVDSVLEYLAFAGTPVYLTLKAAEGLYLKLPDPATTLDVKDNGFLLEVLKNEYDLSQVKTVLVTFGYRRKRASFEAELLAHADGQWVLKKPAIIRLTNARKNPRVTINREIKNEVTLKAETSIGPISFNQVEPFEFSQHGISVFVSRSEGLLLPGDKIESITISHHHQLMLRTSGIVSRVNMKRCSPTIPQSYEIVILFSTTAPRRDSIVQRSSKRIPILDAKPCFFSAEHPLFPGRKLQGQVFEISSSGLSCVLEKTSFPIIPGMRFADCHLQLPHRPSRDLVFEVAHVDYRSDGENIQFKLGGEFVTTSVELMKDISSYEQEVAGGSIQDVSEEDLDLLWEFMFETNFIYRSKRQQVQNHSKEILQTYQRLLSTENPIVKKIVVKDSDKIIGHISALRFYDNAWLIQHLNALKASAGSAAQQILQGINNFFYDTKAHHKTNTHYLVSFYRPNNLYPSILFGETSKRIADPAKASTIDLDFGLLDEDRLNREISKDVLIEVDTEQAFSGLLKNLIDDDQLVLIRALGLGLQSFNKLQITDEYEKLGLMRERHVLRASQSGQSVYALVEMASPGLNLSELTNSIYLFGDPISLANREHLIYAVLAESYNKYFKPRNLFPPVLCSKAMDKASCVNWSKTYTCWILSESAAPEFEVVTKSILRDFKQLVSERRNMESSMITNIDARKLKS